MLSQINHYFFSKFIVIIFITDPKLKNVNFEYLVNGEKLEPQNLTSTNMKRIFGAHEYSIVGEFDTLQEINEVQIIMKAEDTTGNIEKMISLKPCLPDTPIALPAVENRVDQETIEIENRTSEYAVDFDLFETRMRCLPMPNLPPNQIPNSGWVYSPSEEFMSRLWAFKRINYLLKEDKTANNSNSNEAEAIKLALEYNFVTDVTSMVVEESDEYVKKGTLIPIPKPLNNFNLDQMSVQHRSMPGPSFPSSRRGRVGGSRGSSRGRSGAVSRRGYSSRSSSGTTSSYIIGGSSSSSSSSSTSSYSRQGRISSVQRTVVSKSASLPQQSFDMSAPQFASMAVDASHQSGMAHYKCNLTRVQIHKLALKMFAQSLLPITF